MVKRRKQQRTVSQQKRTFSAWQPNNWMIVAFILFFFVDQVIQLVDKEYGHRIT